MKVTRCDVCKSEFDTVTVHARTQLRGESDLALVVSLSHVDLEGGYKSNADICPTCVTQAVSAVATRMNP